jgi:hypothetical protein
VSTLTNNPQPRQPRPSGYEHPIVVPAQPGFEIAIPIYSGSRIVEVWWQPIIAWRVELRYEPRSDDWIDFVMPITPGMTDECYVIRFPNGAIWDVFDRKLRDDENVLSYLQGNNESNYAPAARAAH